ncbi:hypothetical protein [Methanobrevibacter sp. DSM 116169]|uniref:hypothetical protein n=1 Tax=Methanobrevibacter sp. DSM 116169 TaxID=3242727 RepID=UPI0038FC2020
MIKDWIINIITFLLVLVVCFYTWNVAAYLIFSIWEHGGFFSLIITIIILGTAFMSTLFFTSKMEDLINCNENIIFAPIIAPVICVITAFIPSLHFLFILF